MTSNKSRGVHAKLCVAYLGTVSFIALGCAQTAYAQSEQPAAQPVEEVLVTGSLIRGASAVGVPVTALSTQDFKETGSITIGDMLRNVPGMSMYQTVATTSRGNSEQNEQINIHNIDSHQAARDLLLIEGMRVQVLGHDTKFVDPSIVPTIAVQRVDVLMDGASATYGSDAISGVANVILKRGYQGAETSFSYGRYPQGGDQYQADALWGRTWDGGDITLSYEWIDKEPLKGSKLSNLTGNFTPWGMDDRTPLGAATAAGVVSIGKPNITTGTGCTNCYTVPLGQNGVGLSWATLSANPGVKDEINPYDYSSYLPAEQVSSAVVTVDQRLMPGVSLFADGVYSNRRLHMNEDFFYTDKQAAGTFVIPTTNPYYPVGAPAGLMWTGNFALQNPPGQTSSETFGRYDFGLNVDLPFSWHGKVYMADTHEVGRTTFLGQSIPGLRTVALGGTQAASGAYAAFTKPANVPYLNPFCDPLAFQTCNSPATLAYINGFRTQNTLSWTVEKGVNFDGPLFSLPGGDVRAAVGLTYDRYATDVYDTQNLANAQPAANAASGLTSNSKNWWATFAQVNVPLVGDANAMPFVRRLELEASWRHDQYSDVGGTSNEKVAIDWAPVDSLTFRGTWGTSFRAPSFTEVAPTGIITISNYNKASSASSDSVMVVCSGGKPTPGSAAALVNPTCDPANLFPGGGAPQGSAGESAFLRGGSPNLTPELGTNWGAGIQWTPTEFLHGLDVQVTYYKIHISHIITTIFPSTSNFNDPAYAFLYFTPTKNGTAEFSKLVDQYFAIPVNATDAKFKPAFQWLEDGGADNIGYRIQDGIDFNIRYDWDMTDLGLGMWDTGIAGTYTLHNWQWSGIEGDPPVDTFHQTLGAGAVLANGIEITPRYNYRARLGWSDNGWSVVGFFNYTSHYYADQIAPPAAILAKFPNYSNLAPEFHTFDLTVGYNTMEKPANTYLQNIAIRLVVNNILDKKPPFQYQVNTANSSPAAFDPNYSDTGRLIQISVTKDW